MPTLTTSTAATTTATTTTTTRTPRPSVYRTASTDSPFYSSLPRSMGSRALPSLPESPTQEAPLSKKEQQQQQQQQQQQPLSRSISLRDEPPDPKELQLGNKDYPTNRRHGFLSPTSNNQRRAVSTSESPLITDLIDDDDNVNNSAVNASKPPVNLGLW